MEDVASYKYKNDIDSWFVKQCKKLNQLAESEQSGSGDFSNNLMSGLNMTQFNTTKLDIESIVQCFICADFSNSTLSFIL